MHTLKPVVGSYGIIGKDFWECTVENGIETRKHYPLSLNDEELKKLIEEKFILTIERKLELVE